MKRFLVLMMVLMALVWSVPAQAEFADMWATVYRWTGGYNSDGSPTVTLATTGITYRVQAAGADTKETLTAFGDGALTSKSNPVTSSTFATDKQIKFRVDPTDSTNDRYVDLVVVDTVGGYTTVVRNFDKYTHSVIIDERPNVQHHGIIFYDHATTASVEQIALSKHTFIPGVLHENLVATPSGSMSIGISGGSSNFYHGKTEVVGYSSLAANSYVLAHVSYASGYFTTGTSSVYTTAYSAAGAAYYGNVHYWFTVTR